MKNRNIAIKSFQFLLKDLAFDILYWPIWWYSSGLKQAATFFLQKLYDQENLLGVSIWMKNLFVPMFGQADWQGRIISFFIRLVNIIIRSVLLGIWALIIVAFFAAYIALPIVATYKLVQLLTVWVSF